jgi:formylglycine-generating enzyme required for sulfatase activity
MLCWQEYNQAILDDWFHQVNGNHPVATPTIALAGDCGNAEFLQEFAHEQALHLLSPRRQCRYCGTDLRLRAVTGCEVLLAIIGRYWLNVTDSSGMRRLDDPADFVRIEIETALEQDLRVVPLFVQGATMPRVDLLPPSLHDLAFLNGLPVRPDPDFHHDMNRLIAYLDKPDVRPPDSSSKPDIGKLVNPPGEKAETAALRDEVVAGETREIVNSIDMKLVLIRRGRFFMGAAPHEEGQIEGEEQHEVEITRPFYIGVYPITQEEYARVMGTNPSWFTATGGGASAVRGMDTRRFPVEMVSWEDAEEFCRQLSEMPDEKKHGRVYRLPTEAQWEYACRGGASESFPFHFGDALSSDRANFDGNYPYGGAPKGKALQRTTMVGSYIANAWGLCDMHGNVWEWCEDWYDLNFYRTGTNKDPVNAYNGSLAVLRGGSWSVDARHCRTAYRYRDRPGARAHDIGFRVVLLLSPDKKVQYLSDMEEYEVRVCDGPPGVKRFAKGGRLGYGEGDSRYGFGKIKVNGKGSPHGLSMCALPNTHSGAKYILGGAAEKFIATVALNDSAGGPGRPPGDGRIPTPLTFQVLGDGMVLWSSAPVDTARVVQECNVDVTGVHVLELRVDCPGSEINAQVVWLEPLVLLK